VRGQQFKSQGVPPPKVKKTWGGFSRKGTQHIDRGKDDVGNEKVRMEMQDL